MAVDGELRALGVEVIAPDDPRYDDARRVWNLAFDHSPTLVVRPAGAQDVAAVLKVVLDNELPFAVRGGGHSYAGHSGCDDGVVIDLSGLSRLDIDPEARTVRVGPGLHWGTLGDALAPYGLAAVGGHVSGVGVPGLLLGGGIGWLARVHGLACDNLLEAEVVTASCNVVRASADENPDLFWGLRGGGGNLGIVTELTLAVHPLDTVYAGLRVYTRERAGQLLRVLRDVSDSAPDDLNVVFILTDAPPAPFIPEALHGDPVVMVAVCWTGPLEEGEESLAALGAFGEPVTDLVGPMPWSGLQHLFDGFNAPTGFHMRSHLLDALDDSLLDTLVERCDEAPTGHGTALVVPLGGAAGRVDPLATAFSHREAAYNLEIAGTWLPGDPDPAAYADWAERTHRATSRWAIGAEINHMADEGPSRVRDAYSSDTLRRLRSLKATWDPDDVFRRNQNIQPAAHPQAAEATRD